MWEGRHSCILKTRFETMSSVGCQRTTDGRAFRSILDSRDRRRSWREILSRLIWRNETPLEEPYLSVIGLPTKKRQRRRELILCGRKSSSRMDHDERKGIMKTRTSLLGVLLVLVALLLSCSTGIKNTNPVDYMKDVVAYEEGDGVIVYFILADAGGAMTTSDGKAELSIKTDNGIELYSEIMQVSKDSFRETTRGLGAFENDVLLCSFGRIKLEEFSRTPDGSVTVVVTFRTNAGKVFEGDDSVYF